MTGAAAFEQGIPAQALASYQRAIQISATQAPAWQVQIRFQVNYTSK
jgi:hypothetical protein